MTEALSKGYYARGMTRLFPLVLRSSLPYHVGRWEQKAVLGDKERLDRSPRSHGAAHGAAPGRFSAALFNPLATR